MLIDHEGNNKGDINTDNAINMAREVGLDLVEISPHSNPPVCKIMDYGKFRYQQQKKRNENKKNQKVSDLKEIKLRPNIDTHDYEVKLKAMRKFINSGDKVKVTLRLRGREMAHLDRSMEILNRIVQDTDEFAKIEFEPKLEGRQAMLIICPK